jgi:hypothetical protein
MMGNTVVRRSSEIRGRVAISFRAIPRSHVTILLVAIVRLESEAGEHDHTEGFVQGDPVLDSVTEVLKDHSAVTLEVGHDLSAAPSSVTLLQGRRKVPVE